MQTAEKYLDLAKSNFYLENYELAKENLDQVDIIYTKYNLSKEITNDYRTRIVAALRSQSEAKLSIDDPAYDEILELFENAKSY